MNVTLPLTDLFVTALPDNIRHALVNPHRRTDSGLTGALAYALGGEL